MGKPADHTGRRFGMWKALTLAPSNRRGGAMWLCRCDCGSEKTVPADTLIKGRSNSCGCKSNEFRSERCKKHGHTWIGGASGTYSSWSAMLQRCENANHKQYADYGGRGINVCERWRKFENFLADMGNRPDGRSLDRISNNGNYEPSNCRWATYSEQTKNRRPLTSHKKLAALVEAAEEVLAAGDDFQSAIEKLRGALAQLKAPRSRQ
jgi:hypothetical protein